MIVLCSYMAQKTFYEANWDDVKSAIIDFFHKHLKPKDKENLTDESAKKDRDDGKKDMEKSQPAAVAREDGAEKKEEVKARENHDDSKKDEASVVDGDQGAKKETSAREQEEPTAPRDDLQRTQPNLLVGDDADAELSDKQNEVRKCAQFVLPVYCLCIY